MKAFIWTSFFVLLSFSATPAYSEVEENNKTLAKKFYENVWFSENVKVVDELVAKEYRLHDIAPNGDVIEPASAQKDVANFFWQNGKMSGKIDYMIADGDLVATRWYWTFESENLFMTLLGGKKQTIPIINVFRFKDGKIVEIWNHRHDIDTGVANFKFLNGLLVGLIPSILFFVLMIVFWRKSRRRS